MSRGMLALGAVLVMAGGVGAGGIAGAATSGGADGTPLTIWGSNFGPQLKSSSEVQIKDGKIQLKVKLGQVKGESTGKALTGRVSVSVSVGDFNGDGYDDIALPSSFTIKPGQEKTVTIPTTLAQRHAINTKGMGANTGRVPATIAIEVDRPAKDGSTTVYRYTKTGHVTVLKRTAAVSLASTELQVGCSLSSCPNPFGDGSVVRVPLVCAGNPVDNETCKGTVTVTVARSGKPSVVWSGSYTVPPGPDSEPLGVAIKTKGTGADKDRYAATIKLGKKEFTGHVTLLK